MTTDELRRLLEKMEVSADQLTRMAAELLRYREGQEGCDHTQILARHGPVDAKMLRYNFCPDCGAKLSEGE